MRSAFQPLVIEALDRLGLPAILRRVAAVRSGVILRLNRVLPREERSLCYDPALVVSETTFVSLLELLRADYTVVPLDELLHRPAGSGGRPKVSLTFDDGWEDTYRIAFPHLLAWQTPATVFACTSLIGTSGLLPEERFSRLWTQCVGRGALEDLIVDLNHWGLTGPESSPGRPQKRSWTRELRRMPISGLLLLLDHLEQRYHTSPAPSNRFLSWREIKVMTETGLVRLGSHTGSHATLTAETERDIRQELDESRHTLWTQTGSMSDSISYPNGAYNRRVLDVVRSVGFQYGLTSRPGTVSGASEPLTIPRISVRSAVEAMARARGEMEFTSGRTAVYFLSSWLRPGPVAAAGS